MRVRLIEWFGAGSGEGHRKEKLNFANRFVFCLSISLCYPLTLSNSRGLFNTLSSQKVYTLILTLPLIFLATAESNDAGTPRHSSMSNIMSSDRVRNMDNESHDIRNI